MIEENKHEDLMKWTLDSGTFYFTISEATPMRQIEHCNNIILDIHPSGTVVGIEVLGKVTDQSLDTLVHHGINLKQIQALKSILTSHHSKW